MELSWELEQLGRAAAPHVVLEGRRLVHCVSDVIRRDDGSVDALVRGDPSHSVSIAAGFPHHGFSCTCGAAHLSAACSHIIAARLRVLQTFHGLDDARTARWERHVESLQTLRAAWSAWADVWLEAIRDGDDTAAYAVLRATGSLHGGVEIARALGGRATVAEQSAFLLRLAAYHDVDGTEPLAESAIPAAIRLADAFSMLRQQIAPEACADLQLAVAGAARRAGTDPDSDWRVEHVFASACRAVGQIAVDGHADPSTIAAALLDAELDAPTSTYPWSAVMVDAIGAAAPIIASPMREQMSSLEPEGGWASAVEPHFRLRAELGLAVAGAPGAIAVLGEWPDAPYDEFLRRLPKSMVPTSRLAFLEAAHRIGRTAWSPGWAPRTPEQPRRTVHDLHRRPHRATRPGDVAIGELVLADAEIGRIDRARDHLREHARRSPDPAHRHEFQRIWAAAELGPGAEASATEIFGPKTAVDDVADLLAAIARLDNAFFDLPRTASEDGLGAVLLTAVLLEGMALDGHARALEAWTWVESFLSRYPDAADDLNGLAILPADAVSEWLGDAVLDRQLALRSRTIVCQLVEGGCAAHSMADLRQMGRDAFVAALEQAPAATAMTAALFALLLGDPRHPALGPIWRGFIRDALTYEPEEDGIALIERAHALEPRCADVGAYQLGIVLAELDGTAPHWKTRREDL